LNHLSNIYKS